MPCSCHCYAQSMAKGIHFYRSISLSPSLSVSLSLCTLISCCFAVKKLKYISYILLISGVLPQTDLSTTLSIVNERNLVSKQISLVGSILRLPFSGMLFGIFFFLHLT